MDRGAESLFERTIGAPRDRLEPRPRDCDKPVARARSLLRDMRRQAALFPEWRAADPVWAMLLDLLVQQDCGRQVCVQSACVASAVPQTTALRHLAQLVKSGDVIRTPDPQDRRRWFVGLSEAARERLLEYLASDA